jgi:3',5'-cyclic AMP phosphodiesterase CpdA
VSDLHVDHRANRRALEEIGEYPRDWLVVAGDVGSSLEQVDWAIRLLASRFARVLWVPGNHELWATSRPGDVRGEERYAALVQLCRRRNVLTPEDPYVEWPAEPGLFIVPMFLLYDYSFRPPDVPAERAVEWAREANVVCGDERRLDPSPWPTRAAWCRHRCAVTRARLDALPAGAETILIGHWPLRYDLARPPRIPRFSIWCGTTETEDWPRRYRARLVVSGHLHLRTTLWREGVRFEEVSLGYPRDWTAERGIGAYLRQLLPGPQAEREAAIRRRHDPFVAPQLQFPRRQE